MTDYISHTPSNPAPAPGDTVTICYDFVAAGVSGPVTLTLDYSPDSVADDSGQVTPENPCITRTIPAAATSLIVVDDAGHSEDHAVPFS